MIPPAPTVITSSRAEAPETQPLVLAPTVTSSGQTELAKLAALALAETGEAEAPIVVAKTDPDAPLVPDLTPLVGLAQALDLESDPKEEGEEQNWKEESKVESADTAIPADRAEDMTLLAAESEQNNGKAGT